ncbi:MAG: ATP-binding cassette domain-containing protein [Paludibacteraceae bacterium]|nr:ATP-binding cassette domain-containing protein [Paludibacteraceae bacterium]
MAFLEIKNIVKKYEHQVALNGVSLNVPENSIYGLLGPNGAGKTTLIRIINRMIAPDSGEVRLNGKIIKDNDLVLLGYLPEERGLYKKMKVGEQALFFAQLKGMKKNDALKALKYWFEKFEIQSWWNRKVEELSKGMAQKVQFIITVLHQPKLLILDEPFSGFDPINTDIIKQEILQLKNNGTTVIFSTHNMSSVEELCENISLIHQAKIILQGKVSDIKASYSNRTFKIRSLQPIKENEHFKLITQIQKDGMIESIIKKKTNESNNVLLSELIQQTEIVAFEELLPSMNDIFIETVQKEELN